MRSFVGTLLLPVPPPPSGGWVPRTPHDGTAADVARHATSCRRCFVGTLLLIPPSPLPLLPPPTSGGWVPRTPHDGTAADAAHAITLHRYTSELQELSRGDEPKPGYIDCGARGRGRGCGCIFSRKRLRSKKQKQQNKHRKQQQQQNKACSGAMAAAAVPGLRGEHRSLRQLASNHLACGQFELARAALRGLHHLDPALALDLLEAQVRAPWWGCTS
jgi:hypothetical protein